MQTFVKISIAIAVVAAMLVTYVTGYTTGKRYTTENLTCQYVIQLGE